MKRVPAKWITSFCFAAALALFVRNPVDAMESPQRVVSINVCTDQLALVLARDGQLRSVSHLSQDPELSVMAAKARKMPVNHAQAEEVFLMKPDLVLTGTFSSRATVGLLRRLGVRVEEFAPARSFDDIEDHMRRMGELLGRQAEASREIDKMKAALAAIQPPTRRKTVALYYANSYTSGRGTLVDEAVRLAGLDNLADKAGVSGSAPLSLEKLVLEKPDILVRSSRDRAPALAFENFEHPALRALEKQARAVTIADNLTVCGGPFSVEAVAELAEAARD
ncbi:MULTISPECIES: ABC transporter substrate-binding protein [Brucella/Ochrobactrum group]|jgi:iron complex transport system substrate-binding protein|uniref:ABC transporter substrate-binding protein n=1 Tax=Brucella pseudintermedia TaxID=370111 RepID=A0ABY5UEA9_9HYPH|nr:MULTISPECIES: ABC transporter substrate-binding protein [Brucella/Ochrobactrum group]KAB2685220.1 ABC transporter substrate-binding protein [Brucella pseudintermedia]MCO7725538.1 ABC transporter substrate-binding protein [Brucella intermedia]NKE76921.1 ABC transporter substrate-binding protein [Ochrobactrum sp. MC-1LL]TWG98732.1 iron complex transport system substrate-binding protein [Ochrobactrum sp. J50]UWL61027.1 ABC transporter substrate-binding protein [Brucella pseudintermedia]